MEFVNFTNTPNSKRNLPVEELLYFKTSFLNKCI